MVHEVCERVVGEGNMNIRFGKDWVQKLKTIGQTMVCEGERLPSLTTIIKELIDEKMLEIEPPSYDRNSGRQ